MFTHGGLISSIWYHIHIGNSSSSHTQFHGGNRCTQTYSKSLIKHLVRRHRKRLPALLPGLAVLDNNLKTLTSTKATVTGNPLDC